MEKIRLGIIGIGNMGTTHTVNTMSGQYKEFVLAAVADINPQRKEWVDEQAAKYNYSEVKFFPDAMSMLDSGEIDACIIAVPHYFHPPYAIACMERGIHVMSEKPAGVYTKQVRMMNEEAKKHPNVVFGMMFNQRTNCVYKKLRELVQSGQYGQMRRVNWMITDWYRPQAYYDSGAWRATWSGEGGGVLLNQCPHNLDLWQWICGMPNKVSTHMHFGKWHDIEVEDDVTTYVEYPNGATGTFITTTGDGHGTNRLDIQMDKAQLIAEYDKLTVIEFDMTEQEFSATTKIAFSTVGTHEVEIELDGENPQHVGVVNAWGGAILRGEPLIANGEEGINGLTLSNAMHLSAWTGKDVTLPIDEDLFYEELMKRVKTSRRKEGIEAVISDTTGSYGGKK